MLFAKVITLFGSSYATRIYCINTHKALVFLLPKAVRVSCLAMRDCDWPTMKRSSSCKSQTSMNLSHSPSTHLKLNPHPPANQHSHAKTPGSSKRAATRHSLTHSQISGQVPPCTRQPQIVRPDHPGTLQAHPAGPDWGPREQRRPYASKTR